MFFQKKIALFGALAFLVACTDYLQQIDDRYGEWDASLSSETAQSSSSSLEESSSAKAKSSGSDMKSSSSSVSSSVESTSSSSWKVATGTMTDSRDGQTYKTVTIGSQTWMAENLNYETDSSFCYNNEESNCAKYGRLYRWAAAVGKSESECGYGKKCSLPSGNIQGVCPSGWHLPSKAEWKTLFDAVGGQSTAGKVLKSTSGWNSSGNGTDAFGFSALPAGSSIGTGGYLNEGNYADFWSLTEKDSNGAYGVYLYYYSDDASLNNYNKFDARSVRCLKGEASEQTVESSSSEASISSSSESMTTSSSSIAETSSSGKESWAYLNPAISYGEMVDGRDGQVYKTVVIGEQEWMAENLNFESDSSFCYNNEESNCAKYGRLYRWAAAMDTLESECGYGSNTCSLPPGNVQGVCPSGWHLPSMAEWDILIIAVGGQTNADKTLKSTIGWSYGTNNSGFSAYPAGGRDYSGGYDYKGSDARFWSSTEKSSTSAYYMLLKNGGGAGQSYSYKNYAYSVRCVKDEGEVVQSSSSVTQQSSSSSKVGEPVGDVLTDDRDGQTYKIVVIGSQTWMAENLNYAAPKSYCFKDSAVNCDTYGRLYTWDVAMDSAGVWSTNGKGCGDGVQCVPTYPVRGICPEGWHLPSKEDWEELFSVVGDPSISGKKLRSTSGWAEGKNGTDAYHFAALPAGVGQGVTDPNFFNKEWVTYFTSSSDSLGFVYSLYLNVYNDDQLFKANKSDWLSVRCLKD